MTAYPSLSHGDAIAAMLAPLTSAPTEYQIYLNKVTVTDAALTFPYLLIRGAPGDRTLVNLPGNLLDLTTTTQVMAVGQDETEVKAALDLAAGLLVGKRPTITGRIPGLIRQVAGSPYIVPTDDVQSPDGQPCYQGVIQFELNSTAAPAT